MAAFFKCMLDDTVCYIRGSDWSVPTDRLFERYLNVVYPIKNTTEGDPVRLTLDEIEDEYEVRVLQDNRPDQNKVRRIY